MARYNLNPRLHCGANNAYIEYHGIGGAVRCGTCSASTVSNFSVQNAVNDWNRKAPQRSPLEPAPEASR